MDKVKFTKMHGLGNDYIFINCLNETPSNLNELSIAMSDRHKGVGGDGIITIEPSEVADFKMRIFNADGSEAQMCGNGSRCVGKFVYDKGLTDKSVLTLETLAGIRTLTLDIERGLVGEVIVDMGEPKLRPADIPLVAESDDKVVDMPVEIDGITVKLTAVSMGNPHGVVFVDNVDMIDVQKLGSLLENHEMWPERANIEFVEVVSPDEVKMRVWERGSGETQACGTGASATVVAGVLTGRTARDVLVRLRGGDLRVRWDNDDLRVYMKGAAEAVFEGVYML